MKIFLLLALFASQALSQEISCEYVLGFNDTTSYACLMTINNPNGFDGFTEITGEHIFGLSDSSVSDVIITSGITTIIPQIICQRFSSLRIFNAAEVPLQIQSLTETSFSGCMSLNTIRLHGRITSIHPNVFMNNFSLQTLELGLVEMSSLPPQVLGFSTSFFGISAPLLTDLPANFFSNAMSLREVHLRATQLSQFRPEWFRTSSLRVLALSGSSRISQIPRAALNGMFLEELRLEGTAIQTLDLSSFTLTERINLISLGGTPMEALDFNLIDRSFSFSVFRGLGMRCASFSTENFSQNREQSLAQLEPCFAAFDARTMAFSASGPGPTWESIRRERMILSVQAASDACVILAMLPGWTPTFEVCFGVESNTRSDLYVDDRLVTSRSTPGILSASRYENFEFTWQNGLVIVNPVNEPPIFIHQLDAFPVRFVGVRTRNGLNAFWNIRQIAG